MRFKNSVQNCVWLRSEENTFLKLNESPKVMKLTFLRSYFSIDNIVNSQIYTELNSFCSCFTKATN